ncbi:unnamed protein product [Amoebophrya sp. A120]|nr:unnamed protein product [Amoebophrya sp. A120]|eukprot:GSA120T00012726001.1
MSFFNCRICTGSLWGEPIKQPEPKPRADLNKAAKKPGKAKFTKRDANEIQADLAKWIDFLHPRALDFFPDQEAVKKVLSEILKNIDKKDDPILGSDEKCVMWHGDSTKVNNDGEESQAVVRIVKPGDTLESVTFVNRVLPFIFADDESFEELMQLPKEPFAMCCGNQLCVNMSHISFQKRRNSKVAEEAGEQGEGTSFTAQAK